MIPWAHQRFGNFGMGVNKVRGSVFESSEQSLLRFRYLPGEDLFKARPVPLNTLCHSQALNPERHGAGTTAYSVHLPPALQPLRGEPWVAVGTWQKIAFWRAAASPNPQLK